LVGAGGHGRTRTGTGFVRIQFGRFTRIARMGEHVEVTGTMDFVPLMREITANYEAGDVSDLTMHDGSEIRLHKLAKDWDPFDRFSAINAMQKAKQKGEILTGLLYINQEAKELHSTLNTSDVPLNAISQDTLCPGSEMLAKLNSSLR